MSEPMPAKAEATPALPGLSPVAGKPIIARFDGGQMSSDAGVLALRELERRLGVADRLAACDADPRVAEHVVHSLADIMRFRIQNSKTQFKGRFKNGRHLLWFASHLTKIRTSRANTLVRRTDTATRHSCAG